MIWEATNLYGKPLCVINDSLVRYYRGRIIWNCNDDNLEKSMILPLKFWLKLLVRSRLFERILHIDIRWATPINNREILFLLQNRVYRFDIQNKELDLELILHDEKPLSYLYMSNRNGVKDSIIIGDYSTNPERNEVKIYQRRIDRAEWKAIYSFPAGTVRHIHGMVQDVHKNCVYIMTGDEDLESGIWITDDNFKSVRPIVVGKQLYRCCQMLPGENCIWYLTDSPSEDNYICKMETGQVSKIKELSGSVIYGTIMNGILYFSTTVEPDAHAHNRIEYWLTNKIGKGIKDTKVHICTLDADGKMNEVIQCEHDRLPLRLCQYASANFCSDGNKHVYFSMNSVKKVENQIYRISV